MMFFTVVGFIVSGVVAVVAAAVIFIAFVVGAHVE